MNLTAPNKIQKLELSHHESHNRNKKLAGYHVFLTRFIVDLRCLSYTEKEKIVSDEKLRGTTAALLVTSPIRSRSPPNPSLPLSGSFEPEDSDTDSDLFLGDPLFAGPCTSSDPLFAGPVGGAWTPSNSHGKIRRQRLRRKGSGSGGDRCEFQVEAGGVL